MAFITDIVTAISSEHVLRRTVVFLIDLTVFWQKIAVAMRAFYDVPFCCVDITKVCGTCSGICKTVSGIVRDAVIFVCEFCISIECVEYSTRIIIIAFVKPNARGVESGNYY